MYEATGVRQGLLDEIEDEGLNLASVDTLKGDAEEGDDIGGGPAVDTDVHGTLVCLKTM